jgi:hypothetical protein
MRIVLLAIAAIALLAVSAQAQGVFSPNSSVMKPEPAKPPDEPATKKVDEKAYKSALDHIPSKQGFDPWQSVRGPSTSKNSQK